MHVEYESIMTRITNIVSKAAEKNIAISYIELTQFEWGLLRCEIIRDFHMPSLKPTKDSVQTFHLYGVRIV